ncbi:GNAT family N-acetyltransferase [Paracoccus spongiarum]|uniref:GNAT family N-acetyltransferase n=1 Tax=Paracoccus spongiarum TaxID=3064387 RepID=A0ABT9JCC7_9RHOB|nr:GNAT family N-acetyltransferase [Paracoccus sp. 2205BS29-5]MDP5307483.1 GNAT family N-acetyltransferase [Paracoccus sp. 2205BS29-5]
MTPDQLAGLHRRCFTDRPRPWSAAEIAAMLALPGVFLHHRTGGFLIGRAIAEEAELLTLAVAPDARRAGLGRQLTEAFAATSRARAARAAFLEVACDNAPALALYAGLGWREAGLRRDYFGPGHDARVLRLAL